MAPAIPAAASGGSDILSSLLADLQRNPLDNSVSVPATATATATTPNKKRTSTPSALSGFSFFTAEDSHHAASEDDEQEPEEKSHKKKLQPSTAPSPQKANASANEKGDEDLFGDEDDAAFMAIADQVERERATTTATATSTSTTRPVAAAAPRKSLWSDISDEEMMRATDEAVKGLYDCLSTTSTNAKEQQQQKTEEVDLMAEEEEEESDDNNNNNQVSFYFLDACEERAMPGSVILFGKVWSPLRGCYESCCVIVKEVERQLLVAPRRGLKDVMELCTEWNTDVRPSLGISSLKMKKVRRHFAWDHQLSKRSHDNDNDAEEQEQQEEEKKEKDSPSIGESEFVKVHYSFRDAEVPQSMAQKGGRTFSRVYGSTSTALELFLLKRRVKGPSWLQVRLPGQQGSLPPRDSHKSWCKHEWTIDFAAIRVAKHQPEAPPLLALSLSVRHYFPPK